VLALDLDPVAVSSAHENARLNGLETRITVLQSDLLKAIRDSEAEAADGFAGGVAQDAGTKLPGGSSPTIPVQIPVQIVVANILAEILLKFVDDVREALEPGGYYIASGIIASKEAEVAAALEKARFTIEEVSREQDWVAIVARKR